MSPEGPQGTYCNSFGKIHDMITVTELEEDLHVITVGIPSYECCWFPGYYILSYFNIILFVIIIIIIFSAGMYG